MSAIGVASCLLLALIAILLGLFESTIEDADDRQQRAKWMRSQGKNQRIRKEKKGQKR